MKVYYDLVSGIPLGLLFFSYTVEMDYYKACQMFIYCTPQ